ncbi:hypothetical protein A2V56_01865 [Candidatus Woesebacteria bacterium RBG_19FT_COMBO_42_9]|uniref:Gram-positive cocci surface proteins LPxTG domain-containing protein n=1 Tax=Candidatus Woesebacteria bacterium RBG_16_42_24 TaxID=1802485 RepID=A0A1F7XKX3_9BACT|nr:MAG: hypothetical protein A2V97_02690 [Candidatus Woesebacteria bacterium RBG_16_42_24]OGM17063.1 MAG: hypothetical protein A2V56_01865 [Candidatus Woesebacteria bacterium RBG_19FT_COMBO_42_9]OGM66906.1 MAG: hypothetical protein A2985_01865 [Candidatus Woesebacteria bacterium RIFCSPLOWO2_01_FULL_43_11]
MLKKFLVAFTLLTAVLSTPQISYAKTVCTQEYGQPVVCREEEQVLAVTHEPKETAIGDINPAILGGALVSASGFLLYLSKRKTTSFIRG